MMFQIVALLPIISLAAVQGASYEFVLENDDIFDTCPEQPDTIGVDEAFNLTQMSFSYSEGSVAVSGNITCQWEGVQPADRIEFRADVYKFQRGTWQPTLITVDRSDFCKTQYDENSLSFQLWTSNIWEGDRVCLNNYGHVYHHNPFNVDTVVEFAAKMAGRHKIVARMIAYDENNIKRENSVCFQITGEYIKVQRVK